MREPITLPTLSDTMETGRLNPGASESVGPPDPASGCPGWPGDLARPGVCGLVVLLVVLVARAGVIVLARTIVFF